jgi:hypothetical protein
MSPTQRTIKVLKEDGWSVAIVEYWNPFARRRVDLFGFIDILALKGDETLALQVTSGTNVSARVKKITDHANIAAVRDAGWRVEVWGWRKLKSGWSPKIVDLS